MNVTNIYETFGEIVAKYEAQGLVPALYLDELSNSQLFLVRKVRIANGVIHRDLVFVPSGITSSDKGVELTSYILFAKDEEQATNAFRRRATFDKFLVRSTAIGAVPKTWGIDANGFIRNGNYVPMFNVKCESQENLDKIVEYANRKISACGRGFVDGVMRKNSEAHISYWTRDGSSCLKDVRRVRMTMLNVVCGYVARKFEVERLGDRGGANEKNICEYLYDKNRGENSGASRTAENYAQNKENNEFTENEVKVYEQQARY